MPSSMIHIRLDDRVKEEAAETLSAMGMSLSDAVRVFLVRVAAEKRIPFILKVPNAATRTAIQEAEDILHSGEARFRNADDMFDELEKNAGE